MNEFIFRGRCSNGEWAIGDVIHYDKDELKIITQNIRDWDILEGGYDVEKNTIGLQSPLKDKDQTPIFQGDIVMDYHGNRFDVCFNGLFFEPKDLMDYYSYQLKVIGNIHDSIHLLEVDEESGEYLHNVEF